MTNEKYPVDNHQLEIMQDNLKYIRENIGWTSEQLAMKIGVTKQTISNIETKKTKLTKLHYIAIRTVLDYGIQQLNDSTKQQKIEFLLETLFDNKDYYQDGILPKKTEFSRMVTASTTVDVAKMMLPILGLAVSTLLNSSNKKK